MILSKSAPSVQSDLGASLSSSPICSRLILFVLSRPYARISRYFRRPFARYYQYIKAQLSGEGCFPRNPASPVHGGDPACPSCPFVAVMITGHPTWSIA